MRDGKRRGETEKRERERERERVQQWKMVAPGLAHENTNSAITMDEMRCYRKFRRETRDVIRERVKRERTRG